MHPALADYDAVGQDVIDFASFDQIEGSKGRAEILATDLGKLERSQDWLPAWLPCHLAREVSDATAVDRLVVELFQLFLVLGLFVGEVLEQLLEGTSRRAVSE